MLSLKVTDLLTGFNRGTLQDMWILEREIWTAFCLNYLTEEITHTFLSSSTVWLSKRKENKKCKGMVAVLEKLKI
jgi:hypothetical protein